MRKLTVLKTDGTQEVIEHKGREPLKVLQGLVGGYVEGVPHFTKFEGKRCRAWANEEGLINGLPLNEQATKLWKEQLGAGPFAYDPKLYGTIVIEQKGETP